MGCQSAHFWPKAAVQLSIAGSEGQKIADCHEGPHPTYCVEKLGNVGHWVEILAAWTNQNRHY